MREEFDLMYTGIWRRVVAFIIDTIILIGLFIVATFSINTILAIPQEKTLFSFCALIGYQSFDGLLKEYNSYLLLYVGIGSILWLLYEIFFLQSRLSATPGKLFLGIEVSYNKKVFYLIVIRALLKFLLIFMVFGMVIEFLVMYLNKDRRTIHDFVTGTQIGFREAAAERVTPRGFWWLILIALVSLTPYYYSNKLAQDSYTEVRYSEVISINNTGREIYEGIWTNGKNWTLMFTYISNKLYIYDSNNYFKEFNYQENDTLVCSDRNGNNYTFERKDDQLIATQQKDNFLRYYEFEKKKYD